MTTSIHILNASGKLAPIKEDLVKIIRKTVTRAKRYLPLQSLDILVMESLHPAALKDMDGMGGYCPSKHRIELSLDLKHPSIKKNLKSTLKKSLLHELHHAARWSKVKTLDDRLIDILVSEGLADCFVEELTGHKPIWTQTVKGKRLIQLTKRMQREYMSTTYSYEDWFIVGSKKRTIPRWTGYAVGYALIKDYLEAENKTASELVHLRADKLI